MKKKTLKHPIMILFVLLVSAIFLLSVCFIGVSHSPLSPEMMVSALKKMGVISFDDTHKFFTSGDHVKQISDAITKGEKKEMAAFAFIYIIINALIYIKLGLFSSRVPAQPLTEPKTDPKSAPANDTKPTTGEDQKPKNWEAARVRPPDDR